MQYVIAVRALCEFTAKQGDLDLRFTPSPSAQEGVAGHGVVAGRRGPGYQAELALAGDYRHLTVRGRADGWDAGRGVLEEIKTHRGDLARQPANHRLLHWAQLKVYGALLCRQLGLAELRLALVYFDIGTQRETVLAEQHSAEALQAFFEEQCERFLQWADQELAHRARRDAALAALRFPHADFRPGQRELAEAVYRGAGTGRCVVAQAPTGIGKTVGTLFPLLKACPGQALDKIYFLTAKTPGRQLALDALHLLGSGPGGLPLRVLELVARDKACEHPDKACHGDACPLAQGFYDRLPAARSAAVAFGRLDKAGLRAVAQAHCVCPYYLGQELARWSDVVVGDYNHFYDSSALLHSLAQANQWRVAVLVDEAHNLVERARRMYSAQLHKAGFDAVRAAAPAVLKPAFDRLNRAWNAIHKDQAAPYLAHPAIPERWREALDRALAAMTEHLAESAASPDARLQDFYFAALQFSRLAETFDTHSIFDVTLDEAARARRRQSVLAVRNVVPAPFLKPRLASARSTALFSATLQPSAYYRDMLGLPEDTAWVEVASPFRAEQLEVWIADHISTRYADRARSLPAIVALMAAQYAAQPGNYLAFFSSFDYMRQAAAALREQHPALPVWEQSSGMDEAAREQFLARFTPEGRGIAFAVLGGAFAEGVDLPGKRLVGAFVATLGLPQVNVVNEQVKRCIDERLGAGQDYTYLYPGLRKVVQAAGRVIRTTEDRGVVYLMDDRFAQPRVQRLLPSWWAVRRISRRLQPAVLADQA